jgi:hypothetical protein
VTGPLTEGARVVASVVGVVVGDEAAMDAGWAYIATASGHLVAVPIHATGVSITTIPAGPPTSAELARLRDMAREGREMTSTGRMDQGSAGQPVGRPGDGGTAATTRALPADPDPLPEWERKVLDQDTCVAGDPDPTPDVPALDTCRDVGPRGFSCTRWRGHGGQHVAGGINTSRPEGQRRRVVDVWPQSTPDAEQSYWDEYRQTGREDR